jgi:hypothetical protein
MGQHATPDQFLPPRLSQGRLAPYVAASGSLPRAVDLYSWNIAASGAIYETLHVTEVVLRNAMHDALADSHRAAGHAGSWMDDPNGLLTHEHVADIAKARSRVNRKAIPTEGHVVAELNLGFWRFLLARRYQDNLWRTALCGLSPRYGSKGQ